MQGSFNLVIRHILTVGQIHFSECLSLYSANCLFVTPETYICIYFRNAKWSLNVWKTVVCQY